MQKINKTHNSLKKLPSQ